jgi:hypothetical protein
MRELLLAMSRADGAAREANKKYEKAAAATATAAAAAAK